MGLRLGLETLAARGVGAMSRLRAAAAGRHSPGSCCGSSIPVRSTRSPRGCRRESRLVSGTNGKTTTTAMAARILGREHRLAWNRAGARTSSRGSPPPWSRPTARTSGCSRSTKPPCRRRSSARVRAPILLTNLFRDQLDRYGELEVVAERWRAAVERLPDETVLVVNGDDPGGRGPRGRRDRALRFGLDDERHARPSLQHAADSKYCLRCGAPYVYEAAYVGHLGDYRCEVCGHARPQLDVVAGTSTTSACMRLASVSSRARARSTSTSRPGLYNVYNALAASALALALGRRRAVRRGPRRVQRGVRRFERIPAGGKRIVMLLIKNPAGANEALRTLETGVPPVLVIALNDAIADGRDVSWIWDVDFEPILPHVERVVASGDRAAELGLRLVYGGLPDDRLEVVPGLEAALDRGLELVEAGTEVVVLPTYTAMLALRGVLAERGLVRPYWERST